MKTHAGTSLCRIELFGGLQLIQDDRVITRFRTQKTGSLLAYLAYHRGRRHSREVLVDLLWPDAEPSDAQRSLRVALTSLRHQLEPPELPVGWVLQADRLTVALNADAVSTDVADLKAALQDAAAAGSPSERLQHLERAVGLYGGELLAGHYEDWILPEQRKQAERYFQALETLLGELSRAGRVNAAIEYARRGLSLDPLREPLHTALMRLYGAAGEPLLALRQYQELRDVLARELGARPADSTDELAQRMEALAARQGLHPSPLEMPDRPEETPAALPGGMLTCLLTDIEGSTNLWEKVGERFREALTTHHALLRRQFLRHHGVEVQELGDGFLVAFTRPSDALACAVAGQKALGTATWPEAVGALRVRMALHTGEVELREGEYHGLTLHRASRMLTAAHGGQILCSEATEVLIRRDLDAGVRLVDLGLYRLRDVPLPERLYQVEYAGMPVLRFPPLRAEAGVRSNLPPRFTRFFGRESELQALTSLLALTGPDRLVTLTGPGGMGKTRLALEAASRLVEAYHGAVWFVPLAGVQEARHIPGALVEALHLPAGQDAPYDAALQALSGQPALLVLDNFEQLVEEGAALVRVLLERAESLRCLVTSRRRLNLSAEREVPLEPMPAPSPADTPARLAACESVQLFLDRAQAARPDFQVTAQNASSIAEICCRLDGIPLALELAAARTQVLGPAQMLAHLDRRLDFLASRQRDVVERHRTLRAAIAWSYDLLPGEVQRFFARLSVFRGGWTLEAAEAVCAEPLALEHLTTLVECSLVREPDGRSVRFRMLDTLREYGAERLEADDLAAANHARYFAAFAGEHLARLRTPGEAESLQALAAEGDNLRAATGWARGSGAWEVRAELSLALGLLLQRRGYQRDAVLPLEEALKRASDWQEAHPRLYACLLRERAGLHADLLEWVPAREKAQAALAVFAGLGEEREVARTENLLGVIAAGQGYREEAGALYGQALERAVRCGDETQAAILHNNLGLLGLESSPTETEQAGHHLEEALRLRRRLGDGRGIAETLNNLGALAQQAGDLAEAGRRYREALEQEQALGHTFGIGRALCNMGEAALLGGDRSRAVRLLIAAERLLREVRSEYAPYAADLLRQAIEGIAAGEVARLREEAAGLEVESVAAWAHDGDPRPER